MNSASDALPVPAGTTLLVRWQAGQEAAEKRLRALFGAALGTGFDALFSEPAPAHAVCVTTSLHLLTLTILNQLYGVTSAEFYKGDPLRYVRTTLFTQRLLGISKLTLGWPVYAFGAECLGQATRYPDQHAPGTDPGKPLIDQVNWRELRTPDLEKGIPRLVEDMLACFADLTGLEPVAHLPAPYSLAADIMGQEALIAALLEAPDLVDELLDHLTQRVLVPWIERLVQRFPNVWIELSDASGSPLFIGPRLCMNVAARPVRRLINEHSWGRRVFVANYRGDHVMVQAGGKQGELKPEGKRPDDDVLAKLIDFKLSVCPEFIIKLDADQLPILAYVEQAIGRGKPLYLGIGTQRIDRHSVGERKAAERDLAAIAAEYARAIGTVSKALAQTGRARLDLAWPGDVYIEDINAESDLGLVNTIVEAVNTI